MSLDIGLPGAFLAGLLSFASPCVLPLVPAYLGFLTGTVAGREGQAAPRRRVIAAAALFVLGFSTVFILLGATASTLGQMLMRHVEALTLVSGVLLVLFGLHMTGLVRIPLLYRQAKIDAATTPAGLVGPYLIGLAFGFGWSPCVGPVLAAILMVAGAEASVGKGMALLAVYAAGIGIPFLIAAAFTGPFLAWAAAARRRLGLIEKVAGALLILTGLAFMTGFMPEVAQWLMDQVPALGAIG
ncbi:cytochrome c biogenesis CcdA family protein [Xanthobacter oligotrophicus]|uniref:cytochrome c biogenesis CcdA family protein n=1 Tax=Xanthobacter oligotrophicus TaxID=2607286 RepID=UPI0011F2CE4C|nr:cytochrome c biogenesis protein CcdA [Xanthobacter oligotrophicus]MCG5236391.1 sulfite exporter TauE/SafE family protein [Xanthobacter oligotrophicus]